MRARVARMRAQMQAAAAAAPASGIAGACGMRGNRGGARGGNGGGAGRMAERMKQDFAEFRTTLSPAQQERWDSALASLASAKRAPVYKLVEGEPEAVVVRIGASDGSRTEVLGGELKEGDLVVIGSARPDASK